MESSSSSFNSAGALYPPRQNNHPRMPARPRFCRHGLAALRTSHTPQNPERRFYCCSRRGDSDDCGMWEWRDPELSGYYKLCFQSMKEKVEEHEEEANSAKYIYALNTVKIEKEEAELNAAKERIDELRCQNAAEKWMTEALMVKIRQLQLAFTCVAFIILVYVLLN